MKLSWLLVLITFIVSGCATVTPSNRTVEAILISKSDSSVQGNTTVKELAASNASEGGPCGFEVFDSTTGSEITDFCGGSDYMLSWDEDENGKFVSGTAVACCLDDD